jgi:hypothetical protein
VQERYSEPRCSEAVRYAAAYPRPPVAQFESAERLQAIVLRRRAAVPVPEHFFAETVPVHFLAEAAAQAQRSAEPEVLAGQAVPWLPEELAARDVAAVRPRVAGHAGVAPEAAEARVGAAAPQPEARGAEVVLRPEAAAQGGVAEVAPQPEARDAAEVLQRAAPGARAAARPSAAPLVFRRVPALPWPAPSPAARFAHAMERLQIASP